MAGLELDRATAARAFGEGWFNLLRRGADGSLVLSADQWRLASLTAAAFHFRARDPNAPALMLPVEQVERLTWDRLPRQQTRSQIRFYLASGDLWTFSGSVDESVLPLP